ncbi:MAG TPA: hypothetical protein VEJ84_18075 [Acidimicrobiales bacterium]|nr:hypothetical protein [Acidimicrobiales bacterium]
MLGSVDVTVPRHVYGAFHGAAQCLVEATCGSKLALAKLNARYPIASNYDEWP